MVLETMTKLLIVPFSFDHNKLNDPFVRSEGHHINYPFDEILTSKKLYFLIYIHIHQQCY